MKSKTRGGIGVFLLLLGLGVFVATRTGWAGFGWAHLKARVYPTSDGLLEWVPADVEAIAIVDPHQIHPAALGSPQGAVRRWLDHVRDDVKNASGVDLAFDVDKVAVTPRLVVMAGRFDGDMLAARLADYKYAKADYMGRSYLVRPGEDAIMSVDGDRLVYGDEASIKAAIDAKGGKSLAGNALVVARLARMGYAEPLLGTLVLAGERPSLRAMITGSTGPQAVTAGVRIAPQGLDLRATIDAASSNAAEELARLLEEKRAGVADLVGATTGPELGGLLAKVARDATIKADATTGRVDLGAHVGFDVLEAIVQSAEKSAPLAEAYKTLRLYQLLVPN